MSSPNSSSLNFDSTAADGEDFVEEYELVKRLPMKFSRRKNDVYISQRTNFNAQKKKVKQLLESGHSEVVLHGLGAAVERVVNLALMMQEEAYPLLDVSVTHDSMRMIDDLKNLVEPGKSRTQSRHTPVIHIKLFTNDHIPTISQNDVQKHPLTKKRKKKRAPKS